MKAISERIKQLRKERKITQRQLAEATGLSLSAIISYENNNREPNSKAMSALERYFNVSGSYLRGESDCRGESNKWEDPDVMGAVQDNLEELFQNILKLLRAGTEHDQKMFFDIAVELLHVLALDDSNQKTTSLELLQSVFATSTQFVDVCINSSKDKILGESRIRKMQESCVSKYESSLLVTVENLSGNSPKKAANS